MFFCWMCLTMYCWWPCAGEGAVCGSNQGTGEFQQRTESCVQKGEYSEVTWDYVYIYHEATHHTRRVSISCFVSTAKVYYCHSSRYFVVYSKSGLCVCLCGDVVDSSQDPGTRWSPHSELRECCGGKSGRCERETAANGRHCQSPLLQVQPESQQSHW